MPLTAKPLPRPSLTLLFFPQRDKEYVHFENSDAVPFEPLATTFSAANAWYLADAALLAYWEPADAAPRFARGGFPQMQFFANPATSTECYAASSDRAIVVSFRGTQLNAMEDAVADGDVKRVAWDGEGRVHRGFLSALDAVWRQLDLYLRALADGRTIWVTGHSLGGALATLAARRWTKSGGSVAGLYTLGSPRIGDKDFANGVDAALAGRSFRFVNGLDGVTQLPFEQWGYAHVGEEHRLDERPPTGSRSGSSGSSRSGSSCRLDVQLIDHTPRRYATLIWNALAAGVGSM